MVKFRSYVSLFSFGIIVIIIFYFVIEFPKSQLDGNELDFSEGHQRELLEHWKEKQHRGSRVNDVVDKKRKDMKLEQPLEDDVKRIKILKMQARQKYLEEQKNRDIKSKRIYDEVESSEEKDETNPVLDIIKTNDNSDIDPLIACLKTSTNPSVTVCVHNISEDVFISKEIQLRKIWEPHILVQIQDILRGDPELGFIDIGANLGFFSLVAAKMGHKVLSVEPFMRNILLLQKAARIENLQSNITILHNGISDKRRKVSLILDKMNQGAIRVADTEIACGSRCAPIVHSILMDDLIKVINFKRAILKIDIEGGEHLAFKHPTRLFQHIYIPYVFMEWLLVREYFVNVDTITKDKIIVQAMITWFISHDYTPFCLATGFQLDHTAWYGWGHDVLWKHNASNEL